MDDDSAPAAPQRQHGRDAYRRLFLIAVAEHRPHVLDDLADVVLPHYQELMAGWRLLDANTLLRQHPSLWPSSTPDPPAKPWHDFWHVLALWRRRSHLYSVVSSESSLDLRAGSAWITDAALDTLEHWSRAGGATKRWELANQRSRLRSLRTFAVAGFDPDTEEPSAYRERTMLELLAQVDAEVRDVTEMHRTWGLLDTTRQKRVPELHAAWTARYQVPSANGRYEGYVRIAGDATGFRSVKSAIEDFAADIGLAKRRGKPGPQANLEGSA